MKGDAHRSIPAVIGGKDGNLSIHLDLPALSPRYMDELIRSSCFVDLLQSGWYPDTKEFTESCAAFRASTKLGLDWSNPDVCVIAVGDGKWPRTAAMFAYRTRWTTIAIDPRCAFNGPVPNVQRCFGLTKTLGEELAPWEAVSRQPFSDYVYACVHSHAAVAELIASMAICPGRAHVISNRCCVDDTLPQRPTHEYMDWGIWSPERRVRIWRNCNTAAMFNGRCTEERSDG
jgi:hypothetical protein